MQIRRRGRLSSVVAVTAIGLTTTAAWNVAPAAAATSDVRINEVESNGDATDWAELHNAGTAAVDISGWKFLDNDDTHTPGVIPPGTTIAAGGFYVIDEPLFSFGLGSADSARLFLPDGTTLVDSYSWTSHAPVTYGRCPDGTGPFVATASSTKGAPNYCSPATTTTVVSGALPWPGDPTVQTADNANVFGGNLSGLIEEGSGGGAPGTLWGARNGPGTLFRLVFDGANWVPDPANDWGAGKDLRYPDGTGDPDAEGVTFAGTSSAGGVYVSAERTNSANTVSRNSILRFDPAAPGNTLTANAEWNLTADLPTTGANLGAEAITWVPDSLLVAQGFVDETTGHAYDPTAHPNHGNGLFFVGLEANGTIYAYALDQAGGGFTRIATIASGLPAVMDLELDRDLNDLWAVCDNTCNGQHTVLRINPTTGHFAVAFTFERPADMPNYNNEGFAIAPATECTNDRKPVYWADDGEDFGHAIRRGDIPCNPIVGSPPPDVPEFPFGALPAIAAAVLFGGWALRRRRTVAT